LTELDLVGNYIGKAHLTEALNVNSTLTVLSI